MIRAAALVVVVACVVVVAWVACRGDDPIAIPRDQWPFHAVDRQAGALALDGAPVAIAQCRVVENARNDGVALDLAHGRGRIRFTRQHLYAAHDPAEPDDGSELHCTKLDRKWQGGIRTDGSRTGYWAGFLDVACDRVTGRLDVTCGVPTAAEAADMARHAAEAKPLPSP